MDDFILAMEQLVQAQQNFSYADPKYIDVAIYQVRAAEELLDVTIKELKKKGEM